MYILIESHHSYSDTYLTFKENCFSAPLERYTFISTFQMLCLKSLHLPNMHVYICNTCVLTVHILFRGTQLTEHYLI